MATQNMISAAISPEIKTAVHQKLDEVKSSLEFLLALKPKEIKELFKAGNAFAPFVEKAYNTVLSHPQILPPVFDAEEFKKDFQLSKDLTSIVSKINELADTINKTLIAANSDAMAASLEVYQAVKQNCDRVAGLNVISEEMGEFFKRSKKKTANA